MLQGESGIEGYTYTFENVKGLYETNNEFSLPSPVFSPLQKQLPFKFQLLISKEEKNLWDEEPFLESNCSGQEKDNRPHIALYLQITDVQYSCVLIKVTFFIMHPIQGKIFSKFKIIFKFAKGMVIGFSEFISIVIFEKLKLRDFTIRCEFETFKRDFKIYEPFLNNELLSDVELCVGEEAYRAHKLILAMSCPVFRELFSIQDSITILDDTNVDPNIFYELLRYIYSGTVKNMESFAFDLFAAVEKYKIVELVNECRKTIVMNLKVTNVIPALLLCHDRHIVLSKSLLFNDCQKFIRNNFQEVINEGVCKILVKDEPMFLSLILRAIREWLNISKTKKVSILSPSIPKASLSNLEECEFFLNNKNLSDVEIHVGSIKYAAHKLLLSLRSPVFSRMFNHQMKETLTGVVEIEGLESEVFFEVLRFIYTNKMVRIDIAREILIAANKYEIADLKLHCETILINELMEKNLFDYFIFSDDHDAKQLKDKCFEFLIDKLYFIEDWNKFFADWSQNLANLRPHLLLEILHKLASDYQLVFK